MDGYLGMIKLSLHPDAPATWLPCDGRPLHAAEYPKLHALIGTEYGQDGPGTFRLPKLTGVPGTPLIKVSYRPGEEGQPLDSMVAQVNFIAGPENPPGWMECDGSLISRAAYPVLARLIGNQFGGDALHIAIPHMPPHEGLRHIICVEGTDPSESDSPSDDD